MNLFLRLIILMLRNRLSGARIGFFDMAHLTFHVWITDQDAFRHMNNGRYLSITDLCVVDYLMRTGLYGPLRRRGWMPVVVHKEITIHRMLKFPDRYQVKTRLAGWEGPYVLMRHRFLKGGALVADSLSIGRIIGTKGERPSVQDLIDGFDLEGVSEAPLLDADCRDRLNRIEAARQSRGTGRPDDGTAR